MITEELATKLFGDNEALGSTIKINDRFDIQVTGVVENIPRNSHIQFDFLLPFQLAPDYMRRWDNKAPLVYVLLNENSNWKEVSKKIVNIYNDHNPGSYPNYFYLQPFDFFPDLLDSKYVPCLWGFIFLWGLRQFCSVQRHKFRVSCPDGFLPPDSHRKGLFP